VKLTLQTVCCGAVCALLTPTQGLADRGAPPGWWLAQAACIRSHEGWPTAATGNGYEGSYQFLASTYASAGGRVVYRNGKPWHWASLDSLAEQTYRAWVVWRRDGGSWRQWGTARACGLR